MSLIYLYFLFAYIGLFSIGGGFAAIALMQQTLIPKGLVTPENFYAMVAISESTPGPMGINMATYVGYSFYGVIGAIVTTSGIVLPSFICIYIIAKFLGNMQHKPMVKSLFMCLKPAVCAMISIVAFQVFCIAVLQNVNVTVDVIKNVNFSILAMYLLLVIMLFKTKLHPIYSVVIGAIFGLLYF